MEMVVEACNVVAQALLKLDYTALPDYICKLVSSIVENNGAKASGFVSAIVREISTQSMESVNSKNNIGNKNMCAFLCKLAVVSPSSVISNVAVIVTFLDYDNYSLRNAVLQVIGTLLIFLHGQIQNTQDEDASSRLKATRDSFFMLLSERVYDGTSYCRSKLLQIWIELCEARVIPVRAYNSVLLIALNRLEDKAIQVRKCAIHLARVLHSYNPFGPVLSEDLFEKLLSELDDSQEDEGRKAEFFHHGIEYIKQSRVASEVICMYMVNSVTTHPVVLECIEYLKTVNQFELSGSRESLHRMLPLMGHPSSESGDIKQAVVDTFVEVMLARRQIR